MTSITFKSESEIHDIAAGLLDRSLPREKWTHAAHLAAAVWMLTTYSGTEVFERLAAIIRAYNEAKGVPNTETSGFHYTITKANLIAAKSVVTAHKREPLYLVTNLLISSRFGSKDWALEFWTKEVLFSPEARGRWIAPDLKALEL